VIEQFRQVFLHMGLAHLRSGDAMPAT